MHVEMFVDHLAKLELDIIVCVCCPIGRHIQNAAIIGRNNLESCVEILANDAIDVFINAGADNHAAIALVVGGQVGSAAAEANPYGGSNDQHWISLSARGAPASI